jgi:DNA-binding MurR/RpiR family transcriptional regulator
VLENPNDVGVLTRCARLPSGRNVKPNTLVRMARQVGFEGYEDFREPFREAIRRARSAFPTGRAGCRSLRKRGDLGGLYADMVEAAMRNIEETFANIDAAA